MPSPIAHTAVGVALYQLWARRGKSPRQIGGVLPPMLAACIGLSMLPDLDAFVGIVLGDLGRYHNNLASAPFFGTLVSLCAAAIAWLF